VNWLVLPLILALMGCSEGAEPAQTERRESPELSATPSATPSAPAATATPPVATAPSAPVPPEDVPGGAGDEEAARVRVDLVIDGEGISPPAVAVAPFLALEFAIRNDRPRPATVSFRGTRVTVPARGIRRLRVEGVRPGRYALDAGTAGKVEVVGAAPNEP